MSLGQGPGGGDGASAAAGPIPHNSAAAIHLDGGPGGGLCLQCLVHAFKNKNVGPINRVQRVGAQAIVGTFLTVATSIAEAEAHIATVQHRLWRRAAKIWTDMHTLPVTNPLRRSTAQIKKFRRYHRSP